MRSTVRSSKGQDCSWPLLHETVWVAGLPACLAPLAPAAAAAAREATASRLLRLRLVDRQPASLEFLLIELLARGPPGGGVSHLDEAEAARLAGAVIADQLHRRDVAERSEQLSGPAVPLGVGRGHVSIVAAVSLEDELGAAAAAAGTFASDGEHLDVTVTDDGIGFDSTRRHVGLGLRGIEERVKELQGVLTIDKADGGGTKLAIRLPWRTPSAEVPLARAAG